MLTILQGLVPPQYEETEEGAEEPDEQVDPDEDKDPLLEELQEDVDRDDPMRHLSAEHLARLYVFALAWGMGALLELSDRKKFDQYVRDKFKDLDLPYSRHHQDATVFDYVVSPTGRERVYPRLARGCSFRNVSSSGACLQASGSTGAPWCPPTRTRR